MGPPGGGWGWEQDGRGPGEGGGEEVIEEEMIDLKEALKLRICVLIVVKKAIGQMNVESQKDQETEEEGRILEVAQVARTVEDILKKNIHLAVAEVQLQNIKDREKIEVEVEVGVKNQENLLDLLDLILVKVVKVVKKNLLKMVRNLKVKRMK